MTKTVEERDVDDETSESPSRSDICVEEGRIVKEGEAGPEPEKIGDHEEKGVDESLFDVYSAIGFVTIEEEESMARKWHESEVRLPKTFKEAMQSPQQSEWWQGMEHDLAAMEDKEVLKLVPEGAMPDNKRTLQTMWRIQLETGDLTNIVRFRPRLCARGDKQEPDVDFMVMEILSSVVRWHLQDCSWPSV